MVLLHDCYFLLFIPFLLLLIANDFQISPSCCDYFFYSSHNLHTDPTTSDPRDQERWQGTYLHDTIQKTDIYPVSAILLTLHLNSFICTQSINQSIE